MTPRRLRHEFEISAAQRSSSWARFYVYGCLFGDDSQPYQTNSGDRNCLDVGYTRDAYAVRRRKAM